MDILFIDTSIMHQYLISNIDMHIEILCTTIHQCIILSSLATKIYNYHNNMKNKILLIVVAIYYVTKCICDKQEDLVTKDQL